MLKELKLNFLFISLGLDSHLGFCSMCKIELNQANTFFIFGCLGKGKSFLEIQGTK